jgi:hypothetical protein
MRTAEIVMAAALMLLSVYFMVHATVLPIGWARGQGPGGGAFPFWLSAIMFLAAAGIFVRELLAAYADRGSRRTFIGRGALRDILIVAGSLLVTIGAIHFVGAYVAVAAFLVFYLRVMGRARWRTIAGLCVATPIVMFFFFEVTLKILLPKGITEPLFIPLYAQFF